MTTPIPSFKFGSDAVEGALAEILSVVDESTLWTHGLGTPIETARLVRALARQRPPEERVDEIVAISQAVRSKVCLARWIPWYPRLSEHEYRNQFYPGYRDHTAHTLHVFLLGLYLYETVSALREPLANHLQYRVKSTEFSTSTLFLEWWTLTALWHDMGYPFEATEFLSDPATRERILAGLATELGQSPFLDGLGASITSDLKRHIYRAGGYYPFEIQGASELLQHPRAATVINTLWWRLGVAAHLPSPLLELDLLTTQSPEQRPPFHDHGLLGAALLAFLADETDTFLANLAESILDHHVTLPTAIEHTALTAWEATATLQPLADMAIEAISFHNISFVQLSQSRAARRLVPPGYQPNLRLALEPHLFFLALVDTLQDWDRHHFLPNSAHHPYRPSTPASALLIQGVGDRIRVSLPNTTDAKETLLHLFGGWLATEDVQGLFDDHPTFSKPIRLSAAVFTDLQEAERSATETRRLLNLTDSRVAEAREILIRGHGDSIITASSLLEATLRDVRDSGRNLTLSDNQVISRHLQTAGVTTLRKLAYTLIEPGCRLSLGTVAAKIGEGGFGTVFQVAGDEERASTGRSYAFKLYHQVDIENEEKLRLFRRGFDAMQALNDHPGVVSVYLFSEVPLGFFMDFVFGPNLQDGIGLLTDIHERLRVALRVAETVADAHARPLQVLHRDIKPGNVLLDPSRGLEPILTDFDLAWIETRLTVDTRAMYANIHYGAPEQFEIRWKEFRQRPCVDVYSVGALIYYLALRQDPPHWRDWSAADWTRFDERLEGELPAAVVSGLRGLLKQMLVAEPAKRMQGIDGAVAALNRLVALIERVDGRVDERAWREQVAYRVTGRVSENTAEFATRTGHARWILQTLQRKGLFHVVAEIGLVVEPRFEGVDFQQYRTKAAKRIDERLRAFDATWDGVHSRRQGFPTQMSTARIEIEGLPITLESASAVGFLLLQINQALE